MYGKAHSSGYLQYDTNFNVKKELHILQSCWCEYVLVLTQIQRHHWILGFNQVDTTIGIPSDGI